MDFSFLQGLAAQSDPKVQQKAAEYFEQLKASEDGWKLCATTLNASQEQIIDDYLKFFCFQVIEHYVKNRYNKDELEHHHYLKKVILQWFQNQATNPLPEKTYLKNKGAQILALMFIADFPEKWPSYFDDILHFLQFGDKAADIYIRVLMSIDTEVVDRDIPHSNAEAQRNNDLKDAMRMCAVTKMVDSWYQIITTYETSNPELVCHCLEAMGAYIAWIDISLLANERFVSQLLHFMTAPLLRESTCDCIHEIIIKGMDSQSKMKLIESFMNVLQSISIFDVDDDQDGDFLTKLAKLVNGIGLQLILCWQKSLKLKDHVTAKNALQSIEEKVPLMLKFLGAEDDDVSNAVFKFAHDYITMLKQTGPMSPEQKLTLEHLLLTIVKKMKFDKSYNFSSEGEDEAMFQDYRKEIKIIFNHLGALDGDLVLTTVYNLTTEALNNWQSMEYQDIEVSLNLFFSLAEAIPSFQTQVFNCETRKSSVFFEVMRLMVTSQVSRKQHPAVTLQYFEIMVRYDRFFNQEQQYLAEVLIAFLDERGLRNKSLHVCSRASYLFSRFVKGINKAHIQGYLEEVLTRVQDLLLLKIPGAEVKVLLSNQDQLFLYETTGTLIIQSMFPPEKKKELMEALLSPVLQNFELLMQSLNSSNNEKEQEAIVDCLNQAMSFASRTSKGFSQQQTMKQCGCVEVYTHTMQVFLVALDAPVHRQSLQAGARQFLHRMVVCMEAEVLPYIPTAMEKLLKNADAKELHDFIPLLNQLIGKFKKSIVPFLQEVFMAIISKIFEVLSLPVDEDNQVAINERKMLQRSYFSIIAALVNCNVSEVLANQAHSNLEEILMTVIRGAVDLPDPTTQKLCFSILKNLIEIWGGKDGLTGFDEFIFKNIVPNCFVAPMKPSFDLADAQSILVVNECASCLKITVEKTGDSGMNFIQNDYLSSQNVPATVIQEFGQALRSDIKLFRAYFRNFIASAKS